MMTLFNTKFIRFPDDPQELIDENALFFGCPEVQMNFDVIKIEIEIMKRSAILLPLVKFYFSISKLCTRKNKIKREE